MKVQRVVLIPRVAVKMLITGWGWLYLPGALSLGVRKAGAEGHFEQFFSLSRLREIGKACFGR